MSAPQLSRLEESVLAIDTRQLATNMRLAVIEGHLLRLLTAMGVPAQPDEPDRATTEIEKQASSPVVQRRRPASVERDDAVLAVLAEGPLSVPEITRAVYKTERFTDREQSVVRATLQRLLRDDRVRCHRRRWELRKDERRRA